MLKFSSILFILTLSFIFSVSKENNKYVFPDDIIFDKYKKICKEDIYINHEKCFWYSQKYEKLISNSLSSVNITTLNETDKDLQQKNQI